MRPETEAELSEIVRAAEGPLRIKGGGTRNIGAPVAGAVLETGGFSGVTLYDPGALTLVVRAGTPLEEVEAVLAEGGQGLPFEPMDHRGLLRTEGVPTIGGVVAANVSGPARIQAGACRDYLLGVRYVDGQGAVVSNGGRVMKNVTGYDLVKLMAGSWGTLGVLTEVAFKVLPKPETVVTLELPGLEDARAVAALSAALGSPYEVTGAAHLPGDAPRTLLRLSGFADSVAYRAQALAAELAPFGTAQVVKDADEVAACWQGIRDVAAFHDAPGDVWRLSVKPSDAPGLVARSGALQAVYDWGGGLVWLRVPEGTDLRAALGAFKGHATLVRASDATRTTLPVFHPEPAPLARISEALRRKSDPRAILNPGLMA